jgi:hypothetical protein
MTADSDALRQRRRRAHKVGDHSLCAPSRCGGKLATLRNLPEADNEVRFAGPEVGREPREYGPMANLVMNTVAAMAFPNGDPREIIAITLVDLASAYDEKKSMVVAREIRTEVKWLLDHQVGQADALAELRARKVVKMADLLTSYIDHETTA